MLASAFNRYQVVCLLVGAGADLWARDVVSPV